MATTKSDRWEGFKNRIRILPGVIRRVHRIVAALWLLSFALSLVVSLGELPGPSIPGLSFIAVIITGSYLLLRPWVRGASTVSDRLKRLKNWNVTRPVFIRRTHRIVAALCLLFLVLALSIAAAGGPESPVVIIPIVALLGYLSITGVYMLLRPWVNRFRTR